ncbi:MAG: polymer-forming cytoskeletal protein [Erysipelotrichaceae bacterium]|nr:polymer-forming cytoskeletal protein [Erysipelotrichaceae bacterium]
MIDFIDYDNPATTSIYANMTLKGRIDCYGDMEVIGSLYGDVDCARYLRVGGYVEGMVISRDMMITAEGAVKGKCDIGCDCEVRGVMEGEIVAENVTISGTVSGNVRARSTIRLLDGGRVTGDVVCGSLNADKGGIIEGNVYFDYSYLNT